jgi:RNA polymerase sigma factor (TIGR02999 family)
MDALADLIRRTREGEPGARDELFAKAYGELRVLARARLRDGGRDAMLDTAALVHEVYIRVVRHGELQPADQRAFFAFASKVMRSVIVDVVRQRQAAHRGGGQPAPVTLDTVAAAQVVTGNDEVLRIDEALADLAKSEPRLAAVVEMRYFGGFGDDEIARALELTTRTVRRDWHKARLLLLAALQS